MRKSQLRIDQMEVEQKLKKEQLKPDLRLKYNPIAEASSAGIAETYSLANYTWGVSFSMPVFLRKERGDVQLMQLKIQEAELKLSNQNAQLNYAVNASFNEWNTTRLQAEIYGQNVEDYRALLEGEKRLFNSGESSLFMVNAREVGYIGAQIKWIEVLGKGRKAALKTAFALGTFEF
ncbi:TolC family protein [bacterium SCSIO 12741]|nr:TolC family protein [bacterium SCSIO 12741]